jgi:hypothetical protein
LNNKEHKNTNRISRKPLIKSPKNIPEILNLPLNLQKNIQTDLQQSLPKVSIDLVLRRADPRLWADCEIWTCKNTIFFGGKRIIKISMDFMGFDGIRMGIHWIYWMLWMLMGLNGMKKM